MHRTVTRSIGEIGGITGIVPEEDGMVSGHFELFKIKFNCFNNVLLFNCLN